MTDRPGWQDRARARASEHLFDERKLGTGGHRLPPAIARPCPDCGAPKDRPCINLRHGGRMASHHRGRLRPPATTKETP